MHKISATSWIGCVRLQSTGCLRYYVSVRICHVLASLCEVVNTSLQNSNVSIVPILSLISALCRSVASSRHRCPRFGSAMMFYCYYCPIISLASKVMKVMFRRISQHSQLGGPTVVHNLAVLSQVLLRRTTFSDPPKNRARSGQYNENTI